MGVSDRRRAPFCWLSVAALELIARQVPEGTVAGVRNTYLGLAQVAAAARDGHHEGFEATLGQIAAAANVDRATVKRHLPILAELGLLEVEARTAPNGATLASCYVLLEPGQEAGPSEAGSSEQTPGAHDAPPPAHGAPGGGAHGEAHGAPPTRTRPTVVEEERISSPQPPPGGRGSGRRRGSRASGTNPRAVAAQALTTRAGEPPSRHLEATWLAIRHELEVAVGESTWHMWLEDLELLGADGSTLLLTTKSHKWARDRFGRIIAAITRAAEPELEAVEILPAGTTLGATVGATP